MKRSHAFWILAFSLTSPAVVHATEAAVSSPGLQCYSIEDRSHRIEFSEGTRRVRLFDPDRLVSLPSGIEANCEKPADESILDAKMIRSNPPLYSLVCSTPVAPAPVQEIGGVYFFQILNSKQRISSVADAIRALKLTLKGANAELLFLRKTARGVETILVSQFQCIETPVAAKLRQADPVTQ